MYNSSYSIRDLLRLLLWTVAERLLTSINPRRSSSAIRQKADGGGKAVTKFDETTLDEYDDAKTVCFGLLSVYEQTSHAHRAAQDDETPASQGIEKELLGSYLDHAQDAADRLKALADRIPHPVLEALLSKLPAPVLKDILELQK